jgi:hypothetical protein
VMQADNKFDGIIRINWVLKLPNWNFVYWRIDCCFSKWLQIYVDHR